MKKRNLTIFLIVITIILSYLNINNISKKINPNILKYSTTEAKRVATVITNDAVNEIVDNKDLDNSLFSITKNDKDEIQMIDFNTKNVNDLLKEVSKKVQDNILKLEEGKTADFSLGNSIKGKSFPHIRNGIVCEIKGGSLISDDVLLANIGPSIPVKLSFIGEVLTSIKTNIKNYGINNAYLEVNVEVKLTERITVPVLTKDITIIKNIPIAMKVIQGKIPNYYNESIEKLSGIYSLPLDE